MNKSQTLQLIKEMVNNLEAIQSRGGLDTIQLALIKNSLERIEVALDDITNEMTLKLKSNYKETQP